MINRLMWIWRGIDPREILDVQARIVMSEAERTDSELYMIRWWVTAAATGSTNGRNRRCSGSKSQPGRGRRCHAQRQALAACGQSLRHCRVSTFKGDELAEQAQALANRAYEEAAQRLPGGELKSLTWFPSAAAVRSPASCICRRRRARRFPTVLMCGGLDSLQIDYYSLYERYFAPKGIAMLTLDMPSIGFSAANGN